MGGCPRWQGPQGTCTLSIPGKLGNVESLGQRACLAPAGRSRIETQAPKARSSACTGTAFGAHISHRSKEGHERCVDRNKFNDPLHAEVRPHSHVVVPRSSLVSHSHVQPTWVPRRKCLLINAVGNNLLLVRNGKREDDTPAPRPWWGLSWAVSGRVVSCLTSSPGGAKPSGLLGCVAWVAHRFVAAFAFLSHVPALLPGTMEMLL